MMRRAPGQSVILVALALIGILILLAWVVDSGRIFAERQRLTRGVESAAKAGMVVVADRITTQAVARQTEAASRPACSADVPFGSASGLCTATPSPQDVLAWLTDVDRAELISPDMQTPVAAAAQTYASHNGIQASGGDGGRLEINYPYNYTPGDARIFLQAIAHRMLAELFGDLLGNEETEIVVESMQSVEQRR